MLGCSKGRKLLLNEERAAYEAVADIYSICDENAVVNFEPYLKLFILQPSCNLSFRLDHD